MLDYKNIMRIFFVITIFFVATMNFQLAADSSDRKELKDSGYNYYLDSCATCHAIDGKGNGPMSETLTHKPKDLTLLAKENGGSFPETMVYQIIDGRRVVLSHGTREMPVWGRRFKVIDGNEQAVDRRISKIIEFIESIQLK